MEVYQFDKLLEITKQIHKGGESNCCISVSCYRFPFTTTATFTSAILALLLVSSADIELDPLL